MAEQADYGEVLERAWENRAVRKALLGYSNDSSAVGGITASVISGELGIELRDTGMLEYDMGIVLLAARDRFIRANAMLSGLKSEIEGEKIGIDRKVWYALCRDAFLGNIRNLTAYTTTKIEDGMLFYYAAGEWVSPLGSFELSEPDYFEGMKPAWVFYEGRSEDGSFEPGLEVAGIKNDSTADEAETAVLEDLVRIMGAN